MSQLIVRNLDDEVVRRLKARAKRHGRSVEAEHRTILAEALGVDTGKAFKEALLSMPAGGDDTDFERPRQLPRRVRL